MDMAAFFCPPALARDHLHPASQLSARHQPPSRPPLMLYMNYYKVYRRCVLCYYAHLITNLAVLYE